MHLYAHYYCLLVALRFLLKILDFEDPPIIQEPFYITVGANFA